MKNIQEKSQPKTFTGLTKRQITIVSSRKSKFEKSPPQTSIFLGVENYIKSAYSEKRLKPPKIAGCTSAIIS